MPPKKAAVSKTASTAKAKPATAISTLLHKAPKAKPAAEAETAKPVPKTGTKRKAAAAAEVEVQRPKAKKSKAETESTIEPAKKPTKKPAKEPAEKPAKEPAEKPPVVKKATKTIAPKPARKDTAKNVPAKKTLPQINSRSTQRLDIYVFGEGTAGELGLGGVKYDGNKKPIDVTRPRINNRLSAKDVGVVQMAVGGMHCAALTHDNKILTWGVNDTGALGRRTGAAKVKEITSKDTSDDSDSDDDDDDEYLNPTESEPREVNPKYFPEGTQFAFLAASDSATFAVTTDGAVYGWGTFRGNDGDLGFRPKKTRSALEEEEYKDESTEARTERLTKEVFQRSPILIPELKKIVAISCGTNHALALNDKGKVFAWGAGEQNQLARRVVARTAEGALIPREFGLQRKKITKIGSGDYHSFAVDKDGKVYSWGLNTFSQTGIPTSESTDDTILVPTLVKNLTGYQLKEVDGGAHHSIACTESGQVLVWGRIDNKQGGMPIDKFAESDVFIDEHKERRYLTKPVVLPNMNGEMVSAYPDGCLVVTQEGLAYSWGFSGNYQTGLGTTVDVVEATHVDNTAVRGKQLVFCGAGGQFGVLAAVHQDEA